MLKIKVATLVNIRYWLSRKLELTRSRILWCIRRRPRKKWLNKEMRPDNTPDLRRLERSEFHFLFEPGELMSGQHHHRMMHNVPISHVFTHDKYSLLKRNIGLNTFVIPLQGRFHNRRLNEAATPMRLRGELYLVRVPKLIELDRYRKNGVNFQRKTVRLLLPSAGSLEPNRFTSELKAWMYVGTLGAWRKKVEWDLTYFYHDGGRDFSIVKDYSDKHIGPYYHFTVRDYDAKQNN